MSFLKARWMPLPLLLSLVLLAPPALFAQHLEATRQLADPVEPLPLGRIAAATLIGGVAGAAVLGGGGFLLGNPDGEYLSQRQLFAAAGVVVGYPLGAAIGARMAAGHAGDRRPGFIPVYLASAAGALLGGLVWSVVESGPPSFYSGAAAGIATHVAVTSLATVRLGTRGTGPRRP
jgi:hypothetical protein